MLGREKTEGGGEQDAHGQRVQPLPPDSAPNQPEKGGLFLPKCLHVARTAYSSADLREICIDLVFLFMSVQSSSHTTPDI